jgi:uncharacterized membrane protein YkoI
MFKARLMLSAALGALLLASPALAQQSTTDKAKTEMKDDYNKAKETVTGRHVDLASVPAAAMATAHKEIGTNITEAKQERENGQMVYELEGRDSANKERSVHVTADGKLLRKR